MNATEKSTRRDQWLEEAVVSLLGDKDEKTVKEEVSEGIALGSRATLKALNEIYEEAVAEGVIAEHFF